MSAGQAGNLPEPAAQAQLMTALREAWRARRFTVEYQPQINLSSRNIVRFEALLRWQHETKGEIPASEFIPLAEEMGMIGDIGQWVLERACADAMTWPAEIGLAVNVSATRLHDPALPEIVSNALLQSGLAAARLELEITETAAIMMDTQSAGILNALHALGVRITIDDLDVGHSSFRYLLDFAFDKVKVDYSYTALLGQPGRRGDAALVIMQTIAGLCQRLDISCLAEGVETAAQLAIVIEANYTEVQGYLFSKSVTTDKVPAVIREIANIWSKIALPPQREAVAGLSFFQVADAANDVILITNSDLSSAGPKILYVNPAFTRLTGYSAKEAIGQTPRLLQGPGTSRATLDTIKATLREGQAVHEKVLNFDKFGAPYWLDIRIQPIRSDSGTITHFVAIERDITLDKRRWDELEFVADRDILTGIPNRRAFMRAMEDEIVHSTHSVDGHPALCVAWIDVDRFKHINDSFGHPAGDKVLFHIASRLAENMRRVDTVGRLGGDEFAVCMPAIAFEDAHAVANRLRHAVSTIATETASGPIIATVSVGVAQLAAGEGLASLMARADAAMYEAKRAGGDRVSSKLE